MNLGSWEIDDLLTFCVNTHDPETGTETDADDVPSYRVYENETGTPILTGSMAKLDDSNTTGFYSEQITLSAANGFEVGKSYNIRITGVVGGVTGSTVRFFQMQAAALTAGAITADIDANSTQLAAIVADTNELQTDWTDGGRLDLILDGITSSLTTIAGYIDTEIGTIITNIAALNDLSSADVATVIESYGLDHLLVVADPGGLVVDNSLWAKMSSGTGVYSTFDKSTDALEPIANVATQAAQFAAQALSFSAIAGSEVLVSTNILSLTSQLIFRLTSGSTDDDAYNGQTVVITDQLTASQKSVGVVSDYTGSTRQVTLAATPSFTIATGDLVAILAAPTIATSAGLTQADVRTAIGMASANLDSQLSAIGAATNAGDLATKTADSATLTTGSNTSGAYTDTVSDNDVYWITAPVTPAVGGFGLRQQLVFNLPLGRVPVAIYLKGYWTGSGQTAEIYALNQRTATYDKLTNTGTNLASRNNELAYTLMLPRDYADNSGGSFNVVTLELRSTSTNTSHRLRIDQVVVSHVSEASTLTTTIPTPADIWTYVDRSLTTPNTNPVVPPTAAEIRAEIDASSTQLGLIVADTNELQTDWADGGRLDVILDSRASQSSVDDLPTNAELATALAGADDAVLAAIAALNDLSSATVAGLIAAYDAPTNAEMLAAFSGLSSHGDIAWATATSVTVSDKTGFSLTTAYDLYHADIQFTVDEANSQDEYTISWFKNGVRQTSGITSPTIQVVKRVDGTDLIASTALTQIGSTGSYKYDATSAERRDAGEAVLVVVSATIDASVRSFSKLVGRDSL